MADITTFQKTKDNILVFLAGLAVLGLAEMRIEIAKLSTQISTTLPLLEYRIDRLEKLNGLSGGTPSDERLPSKPKGVLLSDAFIVDNRSTKVTYRYFKHKHRRALV